MRRLGFGVVKTSFVVGVLLASWWTATAEAGWIIYFRNGRSVKVSAYTDMGDAVTYQLYGGTVGRPKSDILRIEGTGADAKPNVEVTMIPPQTTTAKDEEAAQRRRADFIARVKKGEVRYETEKMWAFLKQAVNNLNKSTIVKWLDCMRKEAMKLQYIGRLRCSSDRV